MSSSGLAGHPARPSPTVPSRWPSFGLHRQGQQLGNGVLRTHARLRRTHLHSAWRKEALLGKVAGCQGRATRRVHFWVCSKKAVLLDRRLVKTAQDDVTRRPPEETLLFRGMNSVLELLMAVPSAAPVQRKGLGASQRFTESMLTFWGQLDSFIVFAGVSAAPSRRGPSSLFVEGPQSITRPRGRVRRGFKWSLETVIGMAFRPQFS